MEIKKVGISKLRSLRDGEFVSCDKCGECKTKVNQSYTRKMTDPDGELMVLHYIDQEVCSECECEELTIWDNKEVYCDDDPFTYQNLN